MDATRTATSIAIEIERVGVRVADRWLVRDLDLQIKSGETFVLIGPSGSGKTTMLRAINRLVEPAEGAVFIQGVDAALVDPPTLRRGIGYVIQDAGLFAHYTVRRNIGIVLELMGCQRQRVHERVDALLEMVALPPKVFADRYPSQLSGGQRQRVGIARALAADPPIVLLDEPFSALDAITREGIQTEFLGLAERFEKTFVFVTHDIFEAVRLADRIGVMHDGRLIQCDSPRELVHRPANATVAALLGTHRYQLLLMTTRIREVLAHGAVRSEVRGARSVSLGPDASLWEALDRLELEGAEFVQVVQEPGESPCYLARSGLLSIAGGSCS